MRDIMSWATSQRIAVQVPAATGALVIAEAFYKFGSFTLECLAFLATWFVIQLPLSALHRRWRPAPRTA
jgi:hypothetical protein